MTFVAEGVEIRYDRLCLIPLGGQSEIGRAIWALNYAGEILLVDAGASYPGTALPGVDLLLPNTSFLEANQERITALVLTNGSEEHSGAVGYLLDHLKIKRVMAPRFVAALVSQRLMSERAGEGPQNATVIDTIETREPYQIGSFQVEWIPVNDAIADACGLRISTAEGVILYSSSFKLDQTPVDGRQMDMARIAETGDQGVLVLISDSAGVELKGYTPSEMAVKAGLQRHISAAAKRVIVVLPGTNTVRLQILFDLAKQFGRKVLLHGEALLQTAVAAAVTGNLSYDRNIEASLADLTKLADSEVLVVATGDDGDAMNLMLELAQNRNKELKLQNEDTVIFSSEIYPGESRKMSLILDQLLSAGVNAVVSSAGGVHVASHAAQEELKLLLCVAKPKFFVPAIGEPRQIMHHAQLAKEFGMPEENVFALRNGDILEISGGLASVIGAVEGQAVYYNRDQAESVTSFSVNERRSLSMEGILTVGITMDSRGNLLKIPVLEGVALGFSRCDEWLALKEDLIPQIQDIVERHKQQDDFEVALLKGALRDLVAKAVRSRLYAKPAVHIVLHEISLA